MIALYERVSTEEQVQTGFSLGAQKERLEAFCKSQGWTDYEHFTDDGYTGTNMNRPALQRLIRYAERKQISAVVVYKLDRLGRKQKDVLYLLEDVFDKCGVAFKSATEPFDTSTPLGRAMLGILAVFGQLERDTIIERTKSGLRQRARQGLWPSASVPFGYRLEDKILHIVPTEAQIVHQVFEKFIKGESRKSIGEWMQKRVPNRYVDHFIILKMISRRTYLGQIQMREDLFDGRHEAIIDEVTFAAAQKELKARTGGKSPRGTHLLSNLMTCGECGSGVHYFTSRQTQKSGRKYQYVRLQCVKKKSVECDTHSFLAHEIESQVIKEILSMAPDNISIDNDTPNEDGALIKDIESSLEKNRIQQGNLIDAIQNGTVPSSFVKERLAILEADRRGLQEQLDDAIVFAPVDASQFRETIISVQELWNDMSFEDRRDAIRLLINKVHVHKDKRIEINWAF